MNTSYISRVLAAVAVSTVLSSASAQELLWENFVGPAGTAASNGWPFGYRSLLDDIWFVGRTVRRTNRCLSLRLLVDS